MAHQTFRTFLAACATTAFVALPGHTQEAPAPKVSVAAAYMDEMTQDITFIGKGEAIDKVDILARVSGFVEEVLVQDGEPVQPGDVLYKIEPDTYEATLAARQADLFQAKANLDLAQVDLDRKQELFEREVGTEADRDVAEANYKVAEAQVSIAEAAIDLAELDLKYTEVVAPFEGRVGRTNVSVGELVGPNSGPLINLVRTAPIYVEFSLTERQLISIRQELETSVEGVANNDDTPNVYVILPNGTELDEAGRVVFADNRVDPTTGTISLRAEFENKRGMIIDGSFLNVRVEASQPVEVLMIPQAAVQRDQRGDFVLVVGQQQTVEQRYVTLGRQVGTAVVVKEGMREGESVIVEGLQRVRPGVSVDAVLAGTPAEE
ncbi:efflux RND transporter periplasmic adaptor subunit [Shimia sp. SDUM112013]|uniref:efflux RND transporter periplasmic adaptor subunit n=1 Tax=Shimia sp. SDUM112013 TaxID=3136160 RepID=UPI0032EDC133